MPYTILSRPARIAGEPIRINNRWHVKWLYADGSTTVTPYSWPDRITAEFHIDTIMSAESNESNESNETNERS